DVLRALGRDGEAAHLVLAALARASADLPGTAEAEAFIARTLGGSEAQANARGAVERLARLAAAAALAESAPSAIAAAFARARLADSRGTTYGTSGLARADATALIERALPAT